MEEMESKTRNNMKTTICPHCGGELNAGQILGQLSRGTTRRLTPEHRAKLNVSLATARERLAQRREREKKLKWIGMPLDQT